MSDREASNKSKKNCDTLDSQEAEDERGEERIDAFAEKPGRKSAVKSVLIVAAMFVLAFLLPWGFARTDHVDTETRLKVRTLEKVCSCSAICNDSDVTDLTPERVAALHRSGQFAFKHPSSIDRRVSLNREICRCEKPEPVCDADSTFARFCCNGNANAPASSDKSKTENVATKQMANDAKNGDTTDKTSKDAKGDSSSPEIFFLPFFPGESTIAWPLGLSVLSLLLYWYWPRKGYTGAQVLKWVGFSVALGAANFFANALPRFGALTYADGRRVYSYASVDIAEASGYMTLALFGVQAVVLAGIWTRYLGDAAFLEEESSQSKRDLAADALSAKSTIALSDEFARWQRVSVLLVCGFLPGAFTFWRVVAKMHDTRYLMGAALYHCIYAMTWYIVSRPFAYRWKLWHHVRLRALSAAAKQAYKSGAGEKDKLTTLIAALDKLQPIPHNTLVLAALAALIAMLAPFYEVFAK